MEIVVTRENAKPWVFKKTDAGFYECKQRKYTYRLMFDSPDIKPIWIGLILDRSIVTAEKDIRAVSVNFGFGTYIFHR